MIKRSQFVLSRRSVDIFSGLTIHLRACEMTNGLKDMDLRARRKDGMLELGERETRWTVARGMVEISFSA
jgi:hypothetical protein